MNDVVEFMDQFHIMNKRGQPQGVFDYAIHRYLKENIPMFILGSVPYLYDSGVYLADTNGAQLMTRIGELIYPKFFKAPTIKRVYDLFLRDADLQVKFEDLNQYPPEWICFKNGFYDPVNKVMVPHDPKYRAINQIPHEYDPDADPEGGTVKSWLQFIADPEEVQMLLEYVGYCMTRDTRQQRFLILAGEGGTGKSTVIRMLESVIGEANISNVSLNQLTQRFAPYNLLGKLLNSCADLEVTALEDTSILKKILGEDRISAEAKGKDMFSFKSCAKLIFSTNELPIVKSEKTNGFYRRLLILTMNRRPAAMQADFFEKLDTEIDYFIHAAVGALERMYQRGAITETQSSKDAVERLRCDSDTVAAFLRDKTELREKGPGTKRQKLYEEYSAYCREADRQSLTKNNFYRSLRAKNFTQKITQGEYFYKKLHLYLAVSEREPGDGAFVELSEGEEGPFDWLEG